MISSGPILSGSVLTDKYAGRDRITHTCRCVFALAHKSHLSSLFTQIVLMCLLVVNVTSDSSQRNTGLIKALADRRLALSANVLVAGY